MQRCDRYFGRGRQPQIVVSAAEAFLGKFRQLPGSGEAGAVHQHWRQHFPVALAGVQVQHEIDQGTFQPGTLAQQGHKAALRNPHRPLAVEQAQAIGDRPMLLQSLLLTRAAPAAHLNVVVFVLSIRAVARRQVGEGEQLGFQLRGQLFFLVFQHRHLLLDGVALLTQFRDFGALGVGAGLDFLAHFLADPVAFGLEAAALLFEISLLLGDQLQGCEINIHASASQLSRNQLRVLSHQTLIEHRGSEDGAGSLSVRCQRLPCSQRTCPTITAATAENRVIPSAVIGFWPWATATVVITPAPRQAAAS